MTDWKDYDRAKNFLVVAALDWWESKRPKGWTEEMHLAAPTHGLKTAHEIAMARHAAALTAQVNRVQSERKA
jgi:hypothetical protein